MHNNKVFVRNCVPILRKRALENRKFIQVVAGPRQVGKTTAVDQAFVDLGMPTLYASADEATLKDRIWIEQQWVAARRLAKEGPNGAVLVLDEIQKIPNWSETLKTYWDQDTRSQLPLKVFVLGSAPLLIEKGTADSLAGRFEVIPVTHWFFSEMKEAFNLSLEEFLFFGGYPGSASLMQDESRWRSFISNSLVETTISRDILTMVRVDKPALLRQLLHLACNYSGQILSYEKMLGQLHDAGNSTTLAHYLSLLNSAGIVCGLEKYSGQEIRSKASSPKLQVLNNALLTSQRGISMSAATSDPEFFGRLVESAVGSHLVNSARLFDFEVFYWRERSVEVDFIVKSASKLMAIEVKSTARRASLSGLKDFKKRYPNCETLLIGGQGFKLEDFLSKVFEP